MSPDDYEAFPYYYKIWDDWHHFHVFPEGKGTSAELPWYLDFIKYFDKVWKEVELYRQRRASGGNN